jgi:hypothetical protein
VARAEPIHEDFRAALWLLSGLEIPYAEAWRRLVPVAVRLELPRPSYPTVRRVLIEQRRERRRRRERLEPVLIDLLKGRVPNLYYRL